MSLNRYASREVSDLTFYDLVTNKPFLFMDYALTTTNEHSLEQNFARGGRGNSIRAIFHGNKESTLTVSTQIFDWRFIALLSGASVTEGATNVFKREVLTGVTNVDSVEVTLSQTPVEGTVTVFPIEEDAVDGKEEAIVVADTVVTITEGVEGKQYVAYYQFKSGETAQRIKFKSDSFPKTCKIIGDTLILNEKTAELEAFQMVCYKSSPNGTFTLTQASEGDPTTIEIQFQLMANENGEMIDYIQY